jgi:2-dehydro-3-deoxyphosphogluconate aldolase / (4S)-4-hydroxy-2-oxoglutarate aldolase
MFMAQYDRMAVLNAIYDIGIVPVFYHKDPETALAIIKACARGGARVVEFTNRGDLAYQVFAGAAKHIIDNKLDIILGVGSIVDAPTAALYIASGANFVVGPLLNPEVARLCNRRKIPYSPGCGSVSEIAQAEELGVEIIKVFPGKEVGGPSFVKAVLGPCPWTRIMPTGGVESTRESLEAWFKAGVAAVGAGSNLITKELVAARDWDGLTAKVGQCIGWIREIRAGLAAPKP